MLIPIPSKPARGTKTMESIQPLVRNVFLLETSSPFSPSSRFAPVNFNILYLRCVIFSFIIPFNVNHSFRSFVLFEVALVRWTAFFVPSTAPANVFCIWAMVRCQTLPTPRGIPWSRNPSFYRARMPYITQHFSHFRFHYLAQFPPKTSTDRGSQFCSLLLGIG